MNYTKTMGWYYNNANDRSPSWTGVNFLYNFLTQNTTKAVYAEEIDIKDIEIGDVIQLGRETGEFYHTLIVTKTGETPDFDNILVNAHTFNANLRKLDSYTFEKARFLHIMGVLV